MGVAADDDDKAAVASTTINREEMVREQKKDAVLVPIYATSTVQRRAGGVQVQGPSADFFIHPDTMLLMRRLRTNRCCCS